MYERIPDAEPTPAVFPLSPAYLDALHEQPHRDQVLMPLIGEPTEVYQAEGVRMTAWTRVVRALAIAASLGHSSSEIEHARIRAMRYFNRHPFAFWWMQNAHELIAAEPPQDRAHVRRRIT